MNAGAYPSRAYPTRAYPTRAYPNGVVIYTPSICRMIIISAEDRVFAIPKEDRVFAIPGCEGGGK